MIFLGRRSNIENVEVTQALLERLISTKGLAVRINHQDKAFWYTSDKPGPFYINTQNIAGKDSSDAILQEINKLLTQKTPREQQAKQIFDLIDQCVEADKAYNDCIDKLLDYYLSHSSYKPSFISGGERRDWFFSIPIAKKLKLPHVYLFKSGVYQIADHLGEKLNISLQAENALHIADIINYASSYCNKWIPILKETGANFTETLSVAVRNRKGVETLNQYNINVISPLIVDQELFTTANDLGLINEFSFNEINLFYDSPKEWAKFYLSRYTEDNDQHKALNSLEKERMEIFKKSDPYDLRTEFPSFFASTSVRKDFFPKP